MFTFNGDANSWGSRRTYLLVSVSLMVGPSIFMGFVSSAVSVGATGYILSHIAVCAVLGIPLLYMELIIGQFTARDCIDVWKVRPCVSHIGYILVIWQVISVLHNHVINAFIGHYLLISFEKRIPYYTCGSWSNGDCNILLYNFTVNEDCVKIKSREDQPTYCGNLFTTFPEYQYWRYMMLGMNSTSTYHVAWRVCLASGLLCAVTYMSVFKGKRSVKWVITFFAIFPIACYIWLLMCSMLQKGIVSKYDGAIDSDFSLFAEKFQLSEVVAQIILNLKIGSGVTFNLACGSSFRGPCYSNAVLTVVIFAAISVLAIGMSAIIACPYAYEYSISVTDFWQLPLGILYEKTPRLLYEYDNRSFWLVINYGAHAVLGTGSNIILILQLLEMVASRYPTVAKYPGLASFVGIVCLFLLTIPVLCHTGLLILRAIKRNSNFIAMFIAITECLVFVIWYGMDKFSEDVHFMQGLQPGKYMKLSWVLATILLSYTFCSNIWIRSQKKFNSLIENVGWYTFIGTVCLIVIITAMKLLIAVCKHTFGEAIQLDPLWGPKSEILQRSRAMFTGQAMTKEYLYRQYHLQAGILARQRMANIRTLERDINQIPS